ncbi:MAG: POTRA domain-containing protein, partial [Desulfobacterales bacterium]|nr:POTRA domain-containing protein [Desulfobacterales bacterium]
MKIRVVRLLVLVFLTAFGLFYNADVVECGDKKEGETEANGDAVSIRDIVITGNTVIDSETLNKLVEPYKNKDLSMEEMSKVT